MTGILFVDDSQVAQVHKRKEWAVAGWPAGAIVTALELPGGTP